MSASITGTRPAVAPVSEREQRSLAGIPMLVLGLALCGGAVALFTLHDDGATWGGIGLILVAALVFAGLTAVSPARPGWWRCSAATTAACAPRACAG